MVTMSSARMKYYSPLYSVFKLTEILESAPTTTGSCMVQLKSSSLHERGSESKSAKSKTGGSAAKSTTTLRMASSKS